MAGVRGLAAERVPALVVALVAAGARVYAVEPRHESLEERFSRLVGGGGRLMIVLTIARLTLAEAARRRLFLALLMLTSVRRVAHWLGLRPGRQRSSRGGEHARKPAARTLLVSQVLILVTFMFSFVLALSAAFIAAPVMAADLESGRGAGHPRPAGATRRAAAWASGSGC